MSPSMATLIHGFKTHSLGEKKAQRKSHESHIEPPSETLVLPVIQTDNSRVYMDYDITDLPPRPESGWTRFVCISDTHGETFPVSEGDVLIHAGDMSVYGSARSLRTTVNWLKSLSHPVKLIVAGNHDDLLDEQMFSDRRNRIDASKEDVREAREQLTGKDARENGIRYLQYEGTTLSDPSWSVFGSPGTPWHSAGAFQYDTLYSYEINSWIPNNTQILITHGPPLNILDSTRRGVHAGCPDLASRLFLPDDEPDKSPKPEASRRSSKRHTKHSSRSSRDSQESSRKNDPYSHWLPHCRLHVFGHIHEARGVEVHIRRRPRRNNAPAPMPNSNLPLNVDTNVFSNTSIPSTIPLTPQHNPFLSEPLSNSDELPSTRPTPNKPDSIQTIPATTSPVSMAFPPQDSLSERRDEDEDWESIETVFVNAAGSHSTPIIVDLRHS